MTGPGFNFELMTAPCTLGDRTIRLSIRPPWSIGAGELRQVVDDEIAQRRASYPGYVRRGQMTQAEADRHLVLIGAVAADLRGATPDDGPAWADKVGELRREIMLRRRLYPRRVADRRTTEEQARAQMEAMEGVHWQFWIRLTGWTRRGDGPTLSDRLQPVREQAAAVEAWERAARAAGNPAARPAACFTFPAGWTDQQIQDALAA